MIRRPIPPGFRGMSGIPQEREVCSREAFLESKQQMREFKEQMRRCHLAETQPAYEKIMQTTLKRGE